MDDMDSVQAQIARNMLQSGDWVTPRLDGIAYLEKSPLKYWMIASVVCDLWRTRLGGADSHCSFGRASVLGDGALRRLGVRPARGNVCGHFPGYMRRSISLYARADSGRGLDARRDGGALGFIAGDG